MRCIIQLACIAGVFLFFARSAFSSSVSLESPVISIDASHVPAMQLGQHVANSGNILVDCRVSPFSVNFAYAESFIIVVDARTDTDGDGLSDEDEVLIYGTNPTKADTDGDGMSDLEEVIAATDPNLQSSRFVVQSLSALPPAQGGGHNLSFLTSTGRKYTVVYTDDLSSGSWSNLASNISGTGAEVSVPDSNTSTSARYYKVEVEME